MYLRTAHGMYDTPPEYAFHPFALIAARKSVTVNAGLR